MSYLKYSGEAYNPDKDAMVCRFRGLETENVFVAPWKISVPWMERAKENGFTFDRNTAHSVYMEVAQEIGGETALTLELLKNGLTFRVRRSGTATIDDGNGNTKVCETFPEQFAIKRKNGFFQPIANAFAKKAFPLTETLGAYPNIRDEIEGAHSHPKFAKELRFGDLPNGQFDGDPESIQNIIGGLIVKGRIQGVQTAGDLVLKPIVTTTVKRRRTLVYINPAQKIDFDENWPVPEPTKEMRKKGDYYCCEVAVDESTSRQPPPDATIEKIVEAKDDGFGVFKRLTRSSVPLIEYEMKGLKMGRRITDAKAFAAHIKFGLALRDFAWENYQYSLTPTGSKGVTSIGNLPDCCNKNGRLRYAFQAALVFAP